MKKQAAKGAAAPAAAAATVAHGAGEVEVELAAAEVFGKEVLATRVQMILSCRDLLDRDVIGKSDSMVIAMMGGVELGRTEVMRNQLNPNFVRPIECTYRFEERQVVEFSVVDVDTAYAAGGEQAIDLTKQDFLGSCAVVLGDVVGATGMTKVVHLELPQRFQSKAHKKNPLLKIKVEQLPEQNPQIALQFAGENLDRKDLLGKSDPFLRISRSTRGAPVDAAASQGAKQNVKGDYEVVYQSEARKQTLNPKWNEFSMSLQRLCWNDKTRELLIECFDYDRAGPPDFIGAARVSIAALKQAHDDNVTLELLNPKKRGANKVGGRLRLLKCELFNKATFLDYISGGCEVGFSVAIDFTQSNKRVTDPNSLHYYSPGVFNPYMQAIISIGAVLEHYDSDQAFPMYGFGARLPFRNNEKFHCFALNFEESCGKAEVHGMQGVLDTYMRAVTMVALSGPTFFAEVIRTASDRAQRVLTQARQHYDILLIITDGIINDMDNTIAAIIEASKLPMSIIIVGVGDADFTLMDALDSDNKRLGSPQLGYAERDIVQFVPFRDFVNTGTREIDQYTFAKSLLEEIPAQVIQFFESRGISPNPPRDALRPVNTQTALSSEPAAPAVRTFNITSSSAQAAHAPPTDPNSDQQQQHRQQQQQQQVPLPAAIPPPPQVASGDQGGGGPMMVGSGSFYGAPQSVQDRPQVQAQQQPAQVLQSNEVTIEQLKQLQLTPEQLQILQQQQQQQQQHSPPPRNYPPPSG